MKHCLTYLILLLVSVFSACTGMNANDDADALAELKAYFAMPHGHPSIKDDCSALVDITFLTFDLGAKAIPILIKHLDHPTKDDVAAYSLADIQLPEATQALRTAYAKNPTWWLQECLCLSLGASRSEQDIDFLMQEVERGLPQLTIDCRSIQTAILSLGVLRAERALGLLRRAEKKGRAGIIVAAARYAIFWITEGPWETPAPVTGTPEEAIIYAVLRSGLVRVLCDQSFYDKERKCVWTIKGNAWSRTPAAENPLKDAAALEFSVTIAKDRQRARCGVDVYYGALNSSGFMYLLLKEKGAWRVTGILMVSVS